MSVDLISHELHETLMSAQCLILPHAVVTDLLAPNNTEITVWKLTLFLLSLSGAKKINVPLNLGNMDP